MSNPTPREWQTHTQRRADDLAGTNEGDRLAAEATRYGEVADHIEALQHETEAQYKLIERQGEILRAVVNAVRGAHPDGGRWSTHDAAELVLAVVAERDAALADACRAYDKLNGLHISARAHRDRVRELTAERDALRAELAAPRAQEPVNERLRYALQRLLARDQRNTCRHEETGRGGSIWTICQQCGAKWADDDGGMPEWQDPPEWFEARAALDLAAPDGGEPTAAPSAQEPVAPGPLKVGNLPTLSREAYPGLGDWWVQIWHGDQVVGRAYGDTPHAAHEMAVKLAGNAAPQPAAGPAGKSTNDQFCDVVQFNGVTIKHDAALQPAAAPGKFHLGTLVRKKSGAEWQGRIVGSYSTTLTPIGWAVESTAHAGSVQIYPEAALELVEGAASQEPAEKRTDWSAA